MASGFPPLAPNFAFVKPKSLEREQRQTTPSIFALSFKPPTMAELQEDTEEDLRRLMEILAAKRAENIRRKEVARKERESAEAAKQALSDRLQNKRDFAINRIEDRYAREQELLRQKDDAMVTFIKTARERRAFERKEEEKDREESEALRLKAKRYEELESRRDEKIQEKDVRTEQERQRKEAEDRIREQRLAHLAQLRSINERRIEDEARALEEELKVRERDRILIKEARERRILDKERERHEAEEQRKRLERARLEGEITKRRELNVRVKEEKLESELEQRRLHEAQVITQARHMRMSSKDADDIGRDREAELRKRP